MCMSKKPLIAYSTVFLTTKENARNRARLSMAYGLRKTIGKGPMNVCKIGEATHHMYPTCRSLEAEQVQLSNADAG